MKYLLLVSLLFMTACGHKKLVVKNCEKAGNEDLYVCERI